MDDENRHAVPKRQWKKWDDLARYTFNDVYWYMTQNPRLFLHPKAKPPDEVQWNTTAWNAAWMAAEAVREGRLVT